MVAPAYHPPLLLSFPISEFISSGETNVYQSRWVKSPFDWNDLILSWNMKGANNSLLVEVRVRRADQISPWFCLGKWNSIANSPLRTSVNNQSNSWGTVNTDTLHLNENGGDIQIKLTTPQWQNLSLLTASFSIANQPDDIQNPDTRAWGILLPVPKRCQLNYPNGNVVCSATSTSMLLDYWAHRTGDLSLDHDVPEVAVGVFDKAWDGTGNWPFNMAFAGAQPGITAYVTRLSSVRDLEILIGAGYPVACSVSYHYLLGEAKTSEDDGHLVVLVGFSPTGDPIFNDPAVSNEISTTYKRSDFIKAWSDSSQTVYLVYPSKDILPKNTFQEWISK